jgi:hypothetical protein
MLICTTPAVRIWRWMYLRADGCRARIGSAPLLTAGRWGDERLLPIWMRASVAWWQEAQGRCLYLPAAGGRSWRRYNVGAPVNAGSQLRDPSPAELTAMHAAAVSIWRAGTADPCHDPLRDVAGIAAGISDQSEGGARAQRLMHCCRRAKQSMPRRRTAQATRGAGCGKICGIDEMRPTGRDEWRWLSRRMRACVYTRRADAGVEEIGFTTRHRASTGEGAILGADGRVRLPAPW